MQRLILSLAFLFAVSACDSSADHLPVSRRPIKARLPVAPITIAASRSHLSPETEEIIARYPDARRVPGLVLFRWDAPLFFANAEWFHDRILDAVARSPTPVRWVVVTAEPVTSVDVTSADMLAELDDSLQAAGIELCFAEMKDPVKDKLKRFGLFDRFGEQTFFPTIGSAVSHYLATHTVAWDDWEDRRP